MHVVTSHWKEDLKWFDDLPKNITKSVCDKLSNPNYQGTGDCDVPVNHGEEASSYLSYVIKNYDTMPDRVCFIHGHNEAWHQKHNMLDVLSKINENKEYMPDYVSLNGTKWTCNSEREKTNWGSARDRLSKNFPNFYSKYMDKKYTENMTKEQIHNLPREAYETLYADLMKCKNGEGPVERCSHTLEFNWHKIIGNKENDVKNEHGSYEWVNKIMSEKKR